MARPVYQHEIADPDFSWLITTFQEMHPEYISVETSGMPIVFFKMTKEEYHKSLLPAEPIDAPPPVVQDGEE